MILPLAAWEDVVEEGGLEIGVSVDESDGSHRTFSLIGYRPRPLRSHG